MTPPQPARPDFARKGPRSLHRADCVRHSPLSFTSPTPALSIRLVTHCSWAVTHSRSGAARSQRNRNEALSARSGDPRLARRPGPDGGHRRPGWRLPRPSPPPPQRTRGDRCGDSRPSSRRRGHRLEEVPARRRTLHACAVRQGHRPRRLRPTARREDPTHRQPQAGDRTGRAQTGSAGAQPRRPGRRQHGLPALRIGGGRRMEEAQQGL
jgi:hypothetical protein